MWSANRNCTSGLESCSPPQGIIKAVSSPSQAQDKVIWSRLRHHLPPNALKQERNMVTTTRAAAKPRVPDTRTIRDLADLKTRQHAAWSSGDYAIVGTTLQVVGGELCEALDIRAGQKVLYVAAGNGNATFAAARRWCDVVSTG